MYAPKSIYPVKNVTLTQFKRWVSSMFWSKTKTIILSHSVTLMRQIILLRKDTVATFRMKKNTCIRRVAKDLWTVSKYSRRQDSKEICLCLYWQELVIHRKRIKLTERYSRFLTWVLVLGSWLGFLGRLFLLLDDKRKS